MNAIPENFKDLKIESWLYSTDRKKNRNKSTKLLLWTLHTNVMILAPSDFKNLYPRDYKTMILPRKRDFYIFSHSQEARLNHDSC